MSKGVAVEVKAICSSSHLDTDKNKTGVWSVVADPVVVSSTILKTEKGPAIHSASVRFQYTNGSTGNLTLQPFVTGPLVLKAKPTKLKEAGNCVLVDSDSIEDLFGNELAVSKVSAIIKTD